MHDVLEVLGGVGADPRLSGGWGIDALAGEQTRPHRDVDVAILADVTDDAVQALQLRGFAVTTDWRPVRVELTLEERHVDLHLLHYRLDGSAWQAGLGDTTFDYPAHSWVTGRIDGRPVVCLDATTQRLFHSGYVLSDKDRKDLATLDRVALNHTSEASDTSRE